MTEREQWLFDLGQNFPGLLTDAELSEWQDLRNRYESRPCQQEQDRWSWIGLTVTAAATAIALPLLL